MNPEPATMMIPAPAQPLPREQWLTLAEFMHASGWSSRHIRRLAAGGAIVSRPGPAGANRMPTVQYAASSLSPSAMRRHLQSGMEQALTSSSALSPAAPSLVDLTPEQYGQAMERFDLLRPLREMAGGETRAQIVAAISARSGISESTVWRWWISFSKKGFSALANQPRRDRFTSRYFKDREDVAAFVQNKYLNDSRNLTVQQVYRALKREWPGLRRDAQDRPPDYKTLRVYLAALPAPLRIAAREGQKQFSERCSPYLIRNQEPVACNQVWISDHSPHDVWCRNFDEATGAALFGELPKNAPLRVSLTAFQDMRSRKITGCAWSVNPSSRTISSALRVGLTRFGVPATVLVDNGKDFKKVSGEKSAISPFAAGVLKRLGIESHRCLPYSPQGKQIERWFGTLHQGFDRLSPFYCGKGPSHRPEECDKALKHHAELLKSGRGDESPLHPASEFIRLASFWIEEWNATFKHTGRGMGRKSPDEIFDCELPPEKRKPLDIADCAELFWDRQKRTVHEGGTVKIFNAIYQPADADSFQSLTKEIEREILVACDPLNVGAAVALSLDGRTLGRLRAQELLVHGATSAEEISASMRLRHRMYRSMKNYAGFLARHQAGHLTEFDALRRRGRAVSVAPIIHALPALRGESAMIARPHAEDIADAFLQD